MARKIKIFLLILANFYFTNLYASKPLPSNKVLRIGIAQEFANLNPIAMHMRFSTYIHHLIGRALTVLNPDLQWEAQLATQIPSFKNGQVAFIGKGKKRKLKVNWEIKANAKWGDGHPITGHDIAFTWKVAMTKTVSVPGRSGYEQIEKIIVDPKNPKKFTVIHKKPIWDYYDMSGFYFLPKHIEESIFNKYKNQNDGYLKHSLFTVKPATPGLYSGPYRITDVKLGSHVTVVPNKYFFGKKPKIKKIILKVISNNNTIEANLLSGNIDMITIMGLELDQAVAFEKKVKKEKLPFKVNFKPGFNYEHIDLQMKNKLFQNVNVRKALVYAIDRDKLSQAIFYGKQPKAIHFLSPTEPWFTDNPKKVTLYPYSRREAKKLLEKAGWKLRKDRFRYKDGKRFKVTFLTTAGNKTRELVQSYLKEQWRKVGLQIEIKNQPARVMFGQTLKRGEHTGMALFSWINSPETSPKYMLHSKNIPTKENNYVGSNWASYVNKKVDQLTEDLDQEFDPQKRIEIIHKIAKHYTEDVPTIPLYFKADISVTPQNMRGYRLPGTYHDASNHAEKWYLVTAKSKSKLKPNQKSKSNIKAEHKK